MPYLNPIRPKQGTFTVPFIQLKSETDTPSSLFNTSVTIYSLKNLIK